MRIPRLPSRSDATTGPVAEVLPVGSGRLRLASHLVVAIGTLLAVVLAVLTLTSAQALDRSGADLRTTGSVRLAALGKLVDARGHLSLSQTAMDGILGVHDTHVANPDLFEPWYRHAEAAAAALHDFPLRLPRAERAAGETAAAPAATLMRQWRQSGEGLAGILIAPGTSEAAVAERVTAMREEFNATFGAVDELRRAQADAIVAAAEGRAAAAEGTGTRALAAGVVLSALVVAVTFFRWRTTRRRARVADAYERRHLVEARRNELEARLQRGLEMAHSEEESYRLVRRVLTDVAPESQAELLVADSSRTHLDQVMTTGDEGPAMRCGVRTPGDCPAARRGQTLTFADSAAVDACPHLSAPGVTPCSSVCIPMSIAGTTVGVLRTVGQIGRRPSDSTLKDLEMVAQKASERVGLIRAFAQSESQARTDPLTGLLNRRSLEERVQSYAKSGTPYALAFGDLDHFKRLNDVHGHETGDRALRLFSRVLNEHTRPGDVVCRYGGEEFVVLMPECSLDNAQEVLARVQEELRRQVAEGTMPAFTVSFGLSASDGTRDFAELAADADMALRGAKQAGRNRILRAA